MSQAKGEWISVEDEISKARFWSKANFGEYCWEWQGNKNTHGYGTVRQKNKIILAHRVAFSIINNVVLNSSQTVAHSCDNPKCINPYHLFLTDHAGNMEDRHKKYRGTKNDRSSKFMGVSFRADNKKWRSSVRLNGKTISLGNFALEEDAAREYDKYMISKYGFDAVKNNLNCPLPEPPKTK